MEKFEDMKMPYPEGSEEEVMELEFDEAPEEGGDLACFSDDELVKELEARGFMVEDSEEAPAEEPMDEEEPAEEEVM